VSELVIREITAADTHDLRRRVLRTGTPSTAVSFPYDDLPGVVHLGGLLDDRLVVIATLLPRSTPWRPEQRAVQLRGMAVEPALQGSGVGRRLLDAAVERLRAEGTTVLWANARDSALGFYERLGMHVLGDGFVSGETALPHHVVVLDLV
jgi:GNAT superfamily N-acetyltransferase